MSSNSFGEDFYDYGNGSDYSDYSDYEEGGIVSRLINLIKRNWIVILLVLVALGAGAYFLFFKKEKFYDDEFDSDFGAWYGDAGDAEYDGGEYAEEGGDAEYDEYSGEYAGEDAEFDEYAGEDEDQELEYGMLSEGFENQMFPEGSIDEDSGLAKF